MENPEPPSTEPSVNDVSMNPVETPDVSCNGITIRFDDISCNIFDISNNVSVICNKYYIHHGEPSSNALPKKRTFLSVFSIQEQQITTGSPIVFEMNETIRGNCCHNENTGDIWICSPGYYQVYMNWYHLEPCQFSLVKNTTDVIPSSTVGSLSGSSQNSNSFIVRIRNSDMTTPCTMSSTGYACLLQVLNHSTITPYVTLIGSPSSGNVHQQITAAFSILSI
jgi:hypothetical protein